jgi:hypothetical protein
MLKKKWNLFSRSENTAIILYLWSVMKCLQDFANSFFWSSSVKWRTCTRDTVYCYRVVTSTSQPWVSIVYILCVFFYEISIWKFATLVRKASILVNFNSICLIWGNMNCCPTIKCSQNICLMVDLYYNTILYCSFVNVAGRTLYNKYGKSRCHNKLTC